MANFTEPKTEGDTIAKMQTSYYFKQWDPPRKLLFQDGSDEDFERIKVWANTIERKLFLL